ncbi:MAG: hypothetical protein AAB619_01175 [Patescibacteria group bacterium]
MKHLHRQFVLASIGLGFGLVFILGALWNVHAMQVFGWTPIRVLMAAVVSSFSGGVLIVYGYRGVRLELYGPR